MTPNAFRRIALSCSGAVEIAHMKHPDFRANGKVFATLGYPDEQWGMIRLSPEDQEEFVREKPDIFVPAKGAWGRRGCTLVRLNESKVTVVRKAMRAAWKTNGQLRGKQR